MGKFKKYAPILIVLLAAVLAFWGLTKDASKLTSSTPTSYTGGKTAPEIVGAAGYINGDNVKLADYLGEKIILVDFWTYSCINCQRTLPYLTAWDAKYGPYGLQIVGIHTPEFDFEKNITNVRSATQQFGVAYPVVLDNDYKTWRAYGNNYWPRKYIVNLDGNIVYDHIGEGKYAETEEVIQQLLQERSDKLGLGFTIPTGTVDPTNTEQPNAQISPETYFGSLRNDSLANGVQNMAGMQAFTVPTSVQSDKLYLDGEWEIADEYAKNLTSTGRVVYKFKAQKVFIVASADTPTTVRVTLDGKPVELTTSDVTTSQLVIQADRLYRLIELPEVGEHTLELLPDGGNVRFFAFTFG